MTFYSTFPIAVTLGLTVLQSVCAQDVLYQEWVYVERADSTVPMEGYFSMFKCRAELDEHLDLDFSTKIRPTRLQIFFTL